MWGALIRTIMISAVAVAQLGGCATMPAPEAECSAEITNEALVHAKCEAWRAGRGGPFDLLDDDVRWTIVGSSPASKTYFSKEQFLAEVIRPFNARMQEPLKPTIRTVHADGNAVIVMFDAESVCIDGLPYRNSYAWFMNFKDGRVVDVTAFFDTRLFDEMWMRVAP